VHDVIDTLLVCTWEDNKKAACSLAFDDTQMTHYTVAAPELEARGFRGTFNLVTGWISDWAPWQSLFDRGHEIANHTRSHLNLSILTPEEVEYEISKGKADILENLQGVQQVPSFTYPYGSSSPCSKSLAAKYHMNARGSWGINPAAPEDFMLIKGSGYYAPFSLESMNHNLDAALEIGGWYLPYFHMIGSDTGYCPLEIFRSHLDYVKQHVDSVWVAPQGEVGRYIRERESFRYQIVGSSEVFLYVQTGLDPSTYNIPLTLRLVLKPGHPAIWMFLDQKKLLAPQGLDTLQIDVIPETVLPIRVELMN
jgi:peptidoglycan/xylan/chitin deacetylase (PgdA/CDA1 family)